ncbi:hypothetical protein CC86DRAFT_381002 [Ophiobolus disseminans]|uniref:Uncharacterized protein n=1 Tax=Ophiobolus disseminans TaxID=1469910 RepID=A0A6A7A406_9PLEO|nr:hypothetical protein CC86DRAFT_381002 [Ophiobolus disseminans]
MSPTTTSFSVLGSSAVNTIKNKAATHDKAVKTNNVSVVANNINATTTNPILMTKTAKEKARKLAKAENAAKEQDMLRRNTAKAKAAVQDDTSSTTSSAKSKKKRGRDQKSGSLSPQTPFVVHTDTTIAASIASASSEVEVDPTEGLLPASAEVKTGDATSAPSAESVSCSSNPGEDAKPATNLASDVDGCDSSIEPSVSRQAQKTKESLAKKKKGAAILLGGEKKKSAHHGKAKDIVDLNDKLADAIPNCPPGGMSLDDILKARAKIGATKPLSLTKTNHATEKLIECASANLELHSGDEEKFGVNGEADTSATSSDGSTTEDSIDIGTTSRDAIPLGAEQTFPTSPEVVKEAILSPVEDVMTGTITESEPVEDTSEEFVVLPSDEQFNDKETPVAPPAPTEAVSGSVVQQDQAVVAGEDVALKIAEALGDALIPQDATEELELAITAKQSDTNEQQADPETLPVAEEEALIPDDVGTTTEPHVVVKIHASIETSTTQQPPSATEVAKVAYVASVLAMPNGTGQAAAERKLHEELVALHVAPHIEPPSPKQNKQPKKFKQALKIVDAVATPAEKIPEDAFVASFLARPNGTGQHLVERKMNENLVVLHVAAYVEPPSPKHNKQPKKSKKAQKMADVVVTLAESEDEASTPSEFLIETPPACSEESPNAGGSIVNEPVIDEPAIDETLVVEETTEAPNTTTLNFRHRSRRDSAPKIATSFMEREAHLARNTFLGIISLEAFANALPFDESDGTITKADICETFAALSASEFAAMQGRSQNTVYTNFDMPAQRKIKLGKTSLYAFLRTITFGDDDVAQLKGAMQAFRKAAESSDAPSDKLKLVLAFELEE